GWAQAQVAAARGNWVQVGLRNNPAVGYLGQQLGSGGLAEQHAFMIDQEIITAGKRQLSRAEAEQRVAIAEQQLAAQQQRVLTDVRLAFYDALLAQQRLKLAQELLAIAQLGQAAADRLHRAGETSRVDLIQSNLEVESAEIELNKATNQHTYVWMGLSAIIGLPHLPPAVLRGDLDAVPAELTWDQTLARLLTASPELAAAASEIERARWGLARAQRQVIPNVRFQGAVMQDNGIGGKTDGIVQLLVPLPIFNRNQGAIQQARAEVVAAERAIQQLELDLQYRLAPVYQRYATAASQVRRYRERILPKAQESLGLVRRGYEAGEFPYLLLLNSQRTYFQTNLQYLESLRELWASSVEIDGLLLRDSLSARP
ncbi:MAG TPA: TolC family protein, partial [Pirellulaceae bacterium]|nr:TolC family protein [Pirellulaceae bacterium]